MNYTPTMSPLITDFGKTLLFIISWLQAQLLVIDKQIHIFLALKALRKGPILRFSNSPWFECLFSSGIFKILKMGALNNAMATLWMP